MTDLDTQPLPLVYDASAPSAYDVLAVRTAAGLVSVADGSLERSRLISACMMQMLQGKDVDIERLLDPGPRVVSQ